MHRALAYAFTNAGSRLTELVPAALAGKSAPAAGRGYGDSPAPHLVGGAGCDGAAGAGAAGAGADGGDAGGAGEVAGGPWSMIDCGAPL